MSIWASFRDIGEEDMESTGVVLNCVEGNWYPEPNWAEGAVDLAHIPRWCVPGHEEEHDDYKVLGPWMRLGVFDGRDYVSVVMDRQAVLELLVGITDWHIAKKVYPDSEAKQ